MNLTKIIFAVALTAFCYITLTYSLKCYVCNNKDDCKKAKLFECSQQLANETNSYLHVLHTGLNPINASNNFECIREYIKTTKADYYYSGCSYAKTKACSLPLSSYIASTMKKHDCNECDNKDGCNPAGRIYIDLVTVFTTIIVGVSLR